MTSVPQFAGGFSLLCYLHSLGFCRDLLIRTDPGRRVTVRWPLAPSTIDDYTYLSILHNGHVTLFCSDPFVVPCQVNLRQVALVRHTDSANLIVELGFSIANPNWTDSGHYQMEVVTSDGQSELLNVVLYVFRKPSKPIILGRRQVNQGDDVTLTCKSTILSQPAEYRNTSHLRYVWMIGHRNRIQKVSLPADTPFAALPPEGLPASLYGSHVISGALLMIYDIRRNASFLRYRCSVREDNSSLTSSSDDITIDVAHNENVAIRAYVNGNHVTVNSLRVGGATPVWRGHVTVVKGDNVTLWCLADCHPGCRYAWYDASGKAEGVDSILDLVTVNCGTQIHVCHSRNPAAEQTAYVHVEIIGGNGSDPEVDAYDLTGSTEASIYYSTTNSWQPVPSSWKPEPDVWHSTRHIVDVTSGVTDPAEQEVRTFEGEASTADLKSADEESFALAERRSQLIDILILVASVVAAVCLSALVAYVTTLVIRWCRRKYHHQTLQIAGRRPSENAMTKAIQGSVAGRLSTDSAMDKYTESEERRISSVA